ncbi:MAG: ATP-binding cassette domain-containing protein [Campylobacterales bacterium]
MSVLVINNLSFGYRQGEALYEGFSLEVKRGEVVAILGPSGIGKSTLFELIGGFLTPWSGTIWHGRLAQVYQDPYSSFHPSYTIASSISHVSLLDQQEITTLVTKMGLESSLLARYPHELSGGQLQRFSIARALSMKPDLLLADEPVSSLDLSTQLEVMQLMLAGLSAYGLLLVTHDEALANWCADRIVRLTHQVRTRSD